MPVSLAYLDTCNRATEIFRVEKYAETNGDLMTGTASNRGLAVLVIGLIIGRDMDLGGNVRLYLVKGRGRYVASYAGSFSGAIGVSQGMKGKLHGAARYRMLMTQRGEMTTLPVSPASGTECGHGNSMSNKL
jgi:hypothetical protein